MDAKQCRNLEFDGIIASYYVTWFLCRNSKLRTRTCSWLLSIWQNVWMVDEKFSLSLRSSATQPGQIPWYRDWTKTFWQSELFLHFVWHRVYSISSATTLKCSPQHLVERQPFRWYLSCMGINSLPVTMLNKLVATWAMFNLVTRVGPAVLFYVGGAAKMCMLTE